MPWDWGAPDSSDDEDDVVSPPTRDHTLDLPDEILANVFLWVLRGTTYNWRRPSPSAFYGVCRRWRAVLSAHATHLTLRCPWVELCCAPRAWVFMDAHAIAIERRRAAVVVAPPRIWLVTPPSHVGRRRVKFFWLLALRRGVLYFNVRLRSEPVPVVVKMDVAAGRMVGVVEPPTPCTFVANGVVHIDGGRPVDDDGLFIPGVQSSPPCSYSVNNWEPPSCIRYDNYNVWVRGAAPLDLTL